METLEADEATTYLTFTLADRVFAADVFTVREVLDLPTITEVPRTPTYMRGVINLRGSVVPVVDMRLKFGMPQGEDTVNTCIIVMEVPLDGEITVLGALADSVQEVLELSKDQIEPPPRVGFQLNTEFVEGMGKQDDRFIIILNTEKVFSAEELGLVQSLAVQDATTEVEIKQETEHIEGAGAPA